MHTLHKILVWVPGVKISDRATREERECAIRNYAEEVTECYEGFVFTWRITETAGRWRDKYPSNVIFAADDVERFVAELQEVNLLQEEKLNGSLTRLKELAGNDLGEIVAKARDEDCSNRYAITYRLNCVAGILDGKYTENSFYYDTMRCTSRVLPRVFDQVKEDPDEWALVMFDYHN